MEIFKKKSIYDLDFRGSGKIAKAFCRVSGNQQSQERQRYLILEYANKVGLDNVVFTEIQMSTRDKQAQVEFLKFLDGVLDGEILIIADFFRIGRSSTGLIVSADTIAKRNIDFICVSEDIHIPPNEQEMDFYTRMLVSQLSMFADFERHYISERTKARMQAKKKNGVKLGRKKGAKVKSKLDGKEPEIAELLDKKVSKAAIARIMNVSATTMKHFIKTRNLEAGGLLKGIT